MNVDFLGQDDEGMTGVIRPLLTIFKQDVQENEDHYHKGKNFQNQVNCKEQICSLAIDTESCTLF